MLGVEQQASLVLVTELSRDPKKASVNLLQ